MNENGERWGIGGAGADRDIAPASAERRYRVTGFAGQYVHPLTGLPELNVETGALADIEVELALVDGVYVAAPPQAAVERFRPADVTSESPVWIGASALPILAHALEQEILARLRDPRLVFAAVDSRDIDPVTGRDRRTGARRGGELRFMVEYTGRQREIDRFVPAFTTEREDRITPEQILNEVRVDLVRTEVGYVAWRPEGTSGVERVNFSLAEINERPMETHTDASVQQVLLAVRDYLMADGPGRGLIGVIVRDGLGDPVTAITITTGEVDRVRTLAAGERFERWLIPPVRPVIGPDRVDHPAHTRIRQTSPVQPGDLLERRAIDEHVDFLKRHPGRDVRIALAPGMEPNTVNIDYLITENRPLLFYSQISNTGTQQTGRWRFRFGLMHTQLTGNDDILALDYNTAEFTRTHAATGSYEGRVFQNDRLRWRIHGLWSEFQASDVGLPFLQFNGETWLVGGELIWNWFQDRRFFVDVVGGVRYMHASVENIFAPPGIQFTISDASESFLIPYAGLRLSHTDERSSVHASLIFEGSVGKVTGVERDLLSGLGRPMPDKDWFLMQWDIGTSFFLEPVLNPAGFADLTTPESSTLAHEVVLGFKGQHAFRNRLIPQATMTAGGMYSVRGYPESIAAGDTVLITSAEYRFHLPRAFRPSEPGEFFGQPFRWSPQHLYGRPDWDFILRGFIDAGRTLHTDPLAFEVDHTLIGAGIGLEFAYKRFVNLRVDWGFALRGVDDHIGRTLVRPGSNRVHFSATLLY